MVKHVVAVAAAALATASAAQAATLTENFDNVPGWELDWFGTNSNALNYYSVDGNDGRGNNPDGLWVTSPESEPGGGIDVTFDAGFASSLTGFSLDVAGFSPTTLTFFDKNGAILSSFEVTLTNGAFTDPGVYVRYGIESSNGIGGFRFSGEAAGNTSIDNLVAFTTDSAVPEPASWAMLIAGFGLVGAAARRRQTVVAA